jgi:hypothetical protein
MRRWATALAAVVLGVAAPLAAHAADYGRDQLDRGMKEAPALVQKGGVPCTVTSAAYIGASDTKGGGQSQVYEVACQQGLGYVLESSKSGVKAFDCLATEGQASLKCKLPANANPTAGMASVLAAAKVTCTPAKARYVGANATTTVYEVACEQGPGYIIQAPAIGAVAGPTVALPCFETEGKGPMECTLTTKAQSQAAVAALVAKSGKACQMSADRYIGADSKSGDNYIEIGCGTQPGFVLAATPAGGVDKIISCTQATSLGGCTLTDMTAVNAQMMSDYTRRAKAAGFDCDITKFRDIGSDSAHDDIVEIACSNRPDGAVVSFPGSPTGKVRISDCVSSAAYGEAGACTLSSKSAVYARYNAALTAKGRGQCVVNDARYIGSLGNGDSYVETGCTDGKPGWVVDFTPTDQAKDVLSCGQAKSAGIPCQMAGNTKG